MSKKKNAAVKPEGRIKHMLRTNYWLTPLLLVSLVFALVFGISKIPDLSKTVQGWFEKHEKCDECTLKSFGDFEAKVEAKEGTFYVLIGQKDCPACEEFYPVLDKFLKTNKKPANIDMINIDVTMKDEDTYKDSTLTQEKMDKLKANLQEKTGGALVSPTIIKYVDGVIDDARFNAQSYQELMDFFEIK